MIGLDTTEMYIMCYSLPVLGRTERTDSTAQNYQIGERTWSGVDEHVTPLVRLSSPGTVDNFTRRSAVRWCARELIRRVSSRSWITVHNLDS